MHQLNVLLKSFEISLGFLYHVEILEGLNIDISPYVIFSSFNVV